MRIALAVDNPVRDLPGIALVAAKLCEQGATCYLVPLNLEWPEVSALAPDFVLLTNLYRPRQLFARHLLDAGIRVGVLDNEGGVFPSLAIYGQMVQPHGDVYDRVSCFCSWGPKLAEYLGAQGWYRETQLSITGAPRFDFYSPRWRQTALHLSRAVDHYARPLILINGSFPRANPCFQTPEQEAQSWVGLGFSREYILRYQRIESEAIRAMAALANHVAARFPDATVVYRPHPFERVSTYESLLDRRDNLHLVKEGPVDGWILRASVVIHRNSTTAIEAATAGVPVLLPAWIPVGETFESVEAVSLRCERQEDLDRHLDDCLVGHRSLPAANEGSNQMIRDWFHVIDGAAHERVADAVLRQANGHGSGTVSLRSCRNLHYGWHDPTFSTRARAAIAFRMAVGLSASWSFSQWSHRDPGTKWDGSEKRFDAATVRELTDAITSGSGTLTVSEAQQTRDYRFGYRFGRSVAIRPA